MKPRPYYRQAVLSVLVNHEGKFLVGNSPRDGGIKFPQGGIDKGETPSDAVIRELKEELKLNITLNDIVLISSTKVRYEYPEDDDYFIYLGQEFDVLKIKLPNSQFPEPQDDEFDQLWWISKKDMSQFDFKYRTEAYHQAIKLCGMG